MDEATKTFHIGDLITVVGHHLVSPDGIGGIYNVVDYVTGQSHMTHQLPRAAKAVTPWLLEQHPWLADITVPDGLRGEAGVMAWLAPVITKYGERHEVRPMPFGTYVGREPLTELEEMIGPEKVIRVEVPGSDAP